jgi:L-lactate utilization protein LutB
MEMDKNLSFVIEQRVKRTMENLEKNNMETFYVEDETGVIEKVKELVSEGSTVAVGGSMTLFETGVINLLRNGKYNFLDRYAEGLGAEGIKEVFRKSFFADAYFVSSNAVTEEGQLYNVDGTGNRVAAMLYGPDMVIVIVGINKIVKDVKAAEERRKLTAAPANNKRLNLNNPCTKVGTCMDCKSPSRICNDYVLIGRQGRTDRIKVIIVGKELGY